MGGMGTGRVSTRLRKGTKTSLVIGGGWLLSSVATSMASVFTGGHYAGAGGVQLLVELALVLGGSLAIAVWVGLVPCHLPASQNDRRTPQKRGWRGAAVRWLRGLLLTLVFGTFIPSFDKLEAVGSVPGWTTPDARPSSDLFFSWGFRFTDVGDRNWFRVNLGSLMCNPWTFDIDLNSGSVRGRLETGWLISNSIGLLLAWTGISVVAAVGTTLRRLLGRRGGSP